MTSTTLEQVGAASRVHRSALTPIWLLVKVLASAAAICLVLAVSLGMLLPRALGWKVLVVTSGSMNPTIPPGALVGVRPVSPEQVGTGDIITFHRNGSAELVTHRVTSIIYAAKGMEIHTKGDANVSQDPGVIPAEALVGRAEFAVPHVGYAVNRIATPWGAGAAAALVGTVLLAPSRKKKSESAEVETL